MQLECSRGHRRMAPQVPQLCRLSSPTERGLLWAQPRHRVSPPALVSRDALSLCLLVSALLTRFAPSSSTIHQLWQARQFQGSAMSFPRGKKHFFLGQGEVFSLLAS